MEIYMKNNTIRYFQKGFNFSQDGPGNRLVYHLYGCNFRCPWCSNPECFADDTKITVATLPEILSEVRSARPMFFSGGGVTFTGGEPTVQFEALKQLLIYVKEEKIHTALECNASHPRLPELFPHIDWLMMDLKHADSRRHTEITGSDNAYVLRNISAAAECRQLLLRIPLVNGYNTDGDSTRGFAQFLSKFGQNPDFAVELLPYHEYGKIKWRQHGMEYTVKDGAVSENEIINIRQTLSDAGIRVIKT